MLSASTSANAHHEATKHSFRSVQLDPNYVDSSTQPNPFKHYPKFFRRFPLNPEQPWHEFLQLTSAITFQKMYREGAYSLRVNPSAGALYPTEIYVQLRGIASLLDGIYHLEVETNALTLIYELIDDGLEAYFGDHQIIQGAIFLVSCVYFRSSWKYKNRSLRYCFLDGGHHLGAIEAAACIAEQPLQFHFDFDPSLNDDLGFDHQEWITAIAVAGTAKPKSVRRLRSPVPLVMGTDYFEPNRFIETGYQQTLIPSSALQVIRSPQFPFDRLQWQQAIQQRRSARRFHPTAISTVAYQLFWNILTQPIPTASREDIEIYAVVQAVDGLPAGIYRQQTCLKPGEFRPQTGYLCINQAVVRDSAVVFFFVAQTQNYRVALHWAGLLGQRLYLAATSLGLGCSGIGAFYDDETQAFLETDQQILYAVVVGQNFDTAKSGGHSNGPSLP